MSIITEFYSNWIFISPIFLCQWSSRHRGDIVINSVCAITWRLSTSWWRCVCHLLSLIKMGWPTLSYGNSKWPLESGNTGSNAGFVTHLLWERGHILPTRFQQTEYISVYLQGGAKKVMCIKYSQLGLAHKKSPVSKWLCCHHCSTFRVISRWSHKCYDNIAKLDAFPNATKTSKCFLGHLKWFRHIY